MGLFSCGAPNLGGRVVLGEGGFNELRNHDEKEKGEGGQIPVSTVLIALLTA